MNREAIRKAAAMASLTSVTPDARTSRALLKNEMRKSHARVIRKGYPEFDEGQARRNDGRWTSGGGSGGGSSGGSQPREPKSPRDWSKVAAIATDVGLIAAAVLITGPPGGSAVATALGARAISALARTSIGRTAMSAIGT